jgi:hypothetical protein
LTFLTDAKSLIKQIAGIVNTTPKEHY